MAQDASSSSSTSIKSLSLSSLLSEQSRLLKQAARAIPHSFNACTYDQGYIRQAVYLCKTCAGGDGKMGKGICAACSVSCHADHEQLELFPKRNFRCDCATSDIPVPCTLFPSTTDKLPPNADNIYGQNFAGRFCRCDREYDPLTETETMVQCVACEDWWHESCLKLRSPPSMTARTPQTSPSKNPHRTSSPAPPSTAEPSSEPDYATDDDDDCPPEDDETMILQSSSWDNLICGSCIVSMPPAIRRWAGTKHVRMIVRPTKGKKNPDFGGWEVIGGEPEAADQTLPTTNTDYPTAEGPTTKKRSASPGPSSGTTEPPAKKVRLDEDAAAAPTAVVPCTAPTPNPVAQKVLANFAKAEQTDMLVIEEGDDDNIEGEGDLFLADGWRERWCRCDNCLPAFQNYAYLLKEEETYTPPDDPDSKKSLEELGLRALGSLPREQALDSIRAFNDMRDSLLAYLRPFAQDGKVVSEGDVTAFFAALKEGRAPGSE